MPERPDQAPKHRLLVLAQRTYSRSITLPAVSAGPGLPDKPVATVKRDPRGAGTPLTIEVM